MERKAHIETEMETDSLTVADTRQSLGGRYRAQYRDWKRRHRQKGTQDLQREQRQKLRETPIGRRGRREQGCGLGEGQRPRVRTETHRQEREPESGAQKSRGGRGNRLKETGTETQTEGDRHGGEGGDQRGEIETREEGAGTRERGTDPERGEWRDSEKGRQRPRVWGERGQILLPSYFSLQTHLYYPIRV